MNRRTLEGLQRIGIDYLRSMKAERSKHADLSV
jgi:hypothetical protein